MKCLKPILDAVACVLLILVLVAAGYTSVALPDAATVALSNQFSGCDQPDTPFTTGELVSMAVAGKHYTFDTNNIDELHASINAANASAVAAGRCTQADTTTYQQSLDEESISHLDDVYKVVSVAKPILITAALLCVAALMAVGASSGKRTLGAVFIAAGCIVICAFAAFGVWAAIDFYGMFNTFHSLFFSAGSWVFQLDSLLITMYPTAFWMGMGAIWLTVTLVLSILVIIIGKSLRKRNYGKR